jgi:RNA polymerase sigma factor (sigma-70 family)
MSEQLAREVKPLTEEQQRLAVGYIPLARSATRPLKNAFPYLQDEVDGVSMITLTIAASEWDGRIKFATYFMSILRFRINDLLRQEAKKGFRNVNTTNGFLASMDLDVLCALGQDAEEDLYLRDVDETDYTAQMIRVLPQSHRGVFSLFLDGMKQREIAKAIDRSPSRVSCILKESREMLVEFLSRAA